MSKLSFVALMCRGISATCVYTLLKVSSTAHTSSHSSTYHLIGVRVARYIFVLTFNKEVGSFIQPNVAKHVYVKNRLAK